MLVYSAITSLDGYVNDASGGFGWAAPDEEVHAFVNELERSVSTYLYGRRMYEVMSAWEPPAEFAQDEAVTRDYAAIWQAADKIVYSTTLSSVSAERTRLERSFDPEGVRALPGRVSIGGPTFAASALRAGLVDELHQLVTPVVVGGGTPWLPRDLRLDLSLVDIRRFDSGVVHLHYQA
jgi:dihydrofolate reductase